MISYSLEVQYGHVEGHVAVLFRTESYWVCPHQFSSLGGGHAWVRMDTLYAWKTLVGKSVSLLLAVICAKGQSILPSHILSKKSTISRQNQATFVLLTYTVAYLHPGLEWNTFLCYDVFSIHVKQYPLKAATTRACRTKLINKYFGEVIKPKVIMSDIGSQLGRLIPYVKEINGDHQCGFRRNRSTIDHIFCIHQILEKKW